jgi:hypothetical protein
MKEYLAAYASDSDSTDNECEEPEISASPHGPAAPEALHSPSSDGDEVKSPASVTGVGGGVEIDEVDHVDVAVHEARLCDVVGAPQ